MRLKKRNAIIYVILLSCQVPFNIFYFSLVLRGLSKNTYGNQGEMMTGLYFVIAIVYFIVVALFGIRNIMDSFRKEEDDKALTNYMILKYGMIPFFVINFLSVCLIVIVGFMASRGMLLFAFPYVIPILLFTAFATWLAMLPGAFYGIRLIRQGRRNGLIKSGWTVWHMILQFVFVLDLLDAVYLMAVKWKRGRVLSIMVLGLYMIVIGSAGYLFLR